MTVRPKTILITGGAGFLAANLAMSLGKSRTQVRLLDVVECPSWARDGEFTYIRGDVRDPSAVTTALEGVDTVIHAAFAPPYHSSNSIHSVNVDGTRQVCECSLARGVKRMILISSTIVLRPATAPGWWRNSALSRLDLYRQSRTRAERILSAYSTRGLATAIVRPKTFLGPGRVTAFAILFERIRRGRSLPVLGDGNNRYQLLDVRDMAEGIRLLSAAANANGVFSLGARDYGTVREDLQALIEHARTGARLWLIPSPIARALLRGMEMAQIPPLSEWHHMSARGEDCVVDISRSRRELGWEPARSNAEALREAYDWYVASMETTGAARTAHPIPVAHQLLKKVGSIFPWT